MENIQREEKKKLNEIFIKLKDSYVALEGKVKNYEIEFKESMKYLWENRSGMDKMEVFSNEKAVSQIVDSGELTAKQKRTIEKLMDSPYFARIDFQYAGEDSSEPFYIGRFSFEDRNGDMLIYDWRAPISGMYYDFELGSAFYNAPMGKIEGELTRKRQYKIKNGSMEYALESGISISDEVLQKELSHTADQKMKNIVSTIQKEQNQIIRNEKAEVLVIQGVAGSGKTSIALHRIAYFLYKFKAQLSAQNVMIFSPNKVFSDYIANVLPELGEEPILQTGFDEIAKELLGETHKFETSIMQNERIIEGKDTSLTERVKFKSSLTFFSRLQEYAEKRSKDLVVKPETLLEMYQNFFDFLGRPDMLLKRSDGLLEAADVYPFLYLKLHFERHSGYREVKHVVIDEMQDYSPVQYAVINKLFNCKKTILGDFGQALNPYNTSSKEVFSTLYKNAELVDLTKSYRCTYEIIKFAQKIQNQKIDPIERHGDEVKILHLGSEMEEILKISNLLNGTDKTASQTVGIICKTMDHAKKTHQELEGLLKHQKEKQQEIYLLTPDSGEFKSGVIVTTIHMAKGLEFDEVILPSVNSDLYHTEHDRKLLYVACTRAMHRLTITCHGEASRLLPDKI